jgi:dipeptidyl aminopeptidase/acylaminoacyl peptidase
MSSSRALDVDTLWQLQRVGVPALAPDGRQAVCTVTAHDMQANKAASSLWLLPTDRAAPRRLTACGDKDGQPAWSPVGDRIAFIARREQQGSKDTTPQLYTIAADGGEAQRHSDFAPGIESFKWLPDGRRVLFTAWVWPGLKGAAAQANAFKAFGERKESGYATSDAFYRYWDHEVPQGRVLHLLLLDLASGRVTDLFEGSALQLPRDAAGSVDYDAHPDGRRVAFAHDPAPVQVIGNRLVVAEIDLRTRRVSPLADDKAWDFGAPRYSPDGAQLACLGAYVGQHHMAPSRLMVMPAGRRWSPDAVQTGNWDREPQAPLRWGADGASLLFTAEDRGCCHLWRHVLADGSPRVVRQGGWVQGFDVAPGAGGEVIVSAADSAQHPVRVHAAHGAAAPLRLEDFNDRALRGVGLGQVQEVSVQGALGDAIQMWLTFPAGFDARRKHPLMHVIHGGPFAAAGDTFSYRWNAHVLAGRGHVVAQLNYHGSSGFGAAFKQSLVGRQGELELQDIEAGTDWLLAQSWADASRVAATGGSYGGFLVAWMNGHVPPGRYRAYVCHAGVFDRIATFSADSYSTRPKDLAARYWEDMPRVLAQSPHAFASKMHTPTLVIHGAKDYRVPDCNGLAYYNTLKARGVEARLLWFPDENHWVVKPRNSKLWYGEFLDWIGAHTAPRKRSARKGKTS